MLTPLQRAREAWPHLPQYAFDNGPYACNKDPQSSGNQNDFGTNLLYDDIRKGDPYRMYCIRNSVYAECHRPMWLRLNGKPIQAKDHPNLVLQRGLPDPKSADDLGLSTPTSNHSMLDWWGFDQEHWSTMYLCQYAAATRDPLALRMVEDLIQIWILSCPAENRGTTHHKPSADRAQGRILLAGAQMLVVFPEHKELRTHLYELYVNYQKLPLFREWPAINGLPAIFAPWELAQKGMGFEAAYRMLELTSEPYHVTIARYFYENGCRSDPFRVGYRASVDPKDDYFIAGSIQYCLPSIYIVDPELAKELAITHDPYGRFRTW